MEHNANAPLTSLEQILLPVFMLMVFVGIAGGNPSTVLKPLFEIAGHLASMLLSLFCTLVTSLFQALLSLVLSGAQTVGAIISSECSHHINH